MTHVGTTGWNTGTLKDNPTFLRLVNISSIGKLLSAVIDFFPLELHITLTELGPVFV